MHWIIALRYDEIELFEGMVFQIGKTVFKVIESKSESSIDPIKSWSISIREFLTSVLKKS